MKKEELDKLNAGRKWSMLELVTRPGQAREHHVTCFIYHDGDWRVEIVADPWADALIPAWKHWGMQEDAMGQALTDVGKKTGVWKYCDPRVVADIRFAWQKYNEAREAEEAAYLKSIEGAGLP